MTLLFLSTLAVCESATAAVAGVINKGMDAVQPVIKEATTQFFKQQKRFGETCDVRDCEAPWLCYRAQCQECQIGHEKDIVDGLMCEFPKICMPMPLDPSKNGCINPAEWVNCGGHYAASCNACPGGNGKDYCNGDCKWSAPAPAAAPAAAPLEPHAAKSAAASASEAPVYHTYISAPPAAAASEPPPTCVAKATTAAPPAAEIDCSTEYSQECFGNRNCIWVWDGSGLDLATKTTEPAAKTPENNLADEKPEATQTAKNKLDKTGKCLVLESYRQLPAVQTFKRINKQMGTNMDPDQRSESIYQAICDKHSNWRSDKNKGVCEKETEMGVTCVWWNTKLLGGKCVARDREDVLGTEGGKCLIPFYYNDVLYDGCTKAGKNGKTEAEAWCVLDSSIFGWERCAEGSPESTGIAVDGGESNVSGDCPDGFKDQIFVPGEKMKKEKIKGEKNYTKEDCGRLCQAKDDCNSFKIKTIGVWRKQTQCTFYENWVSPGDSVEQKMCKKTPAPAEPEAASFKQRTTQSFLAADNWE